MKVKMRRLPMRGERRSAPCSCYALQPSRSSDACNAIAALGNPAAFDSRFNEGMKRELFSMLRV